MMKIAITGAGGYIGRHVVEEALKRGHSVIVDNRGPKSRSVKHKSLEIFDETVDNVYKALDRPDVLLHLAWKDGFVHNSPEHMANLSRHVDFLNRYIKSGGTAVAIMGTMHEVGYWEGAVTEATPCRPMSQYAIAKNALRQSSMITAHETNTKLYWLRAFYNYGDDLAGNSIFSKIAQAANRGDKVFPFTTGKNKYDFIHIDELSRQIVSAITQTDITGIINVCSGEPVSLADKIEQYIKDNNYNIQLKYGVFPDRPYDSPEIWGDATKITKIMKNSGA